MEDIYLLEDEELKGKYSYDVEVFVISSIKNIKRYGVQKLPKDVWLKVLYYSLKGLGCKDDHLDISQRVSLYERLKDEEISNPYIQQFMKETKEKYKNALL